MKNHIADLFKFELHSASGSPYPLTLTAHKELVKPAWLKEIRQYSSDVGMFQSTRYICTNASLGVFIVYFFVFIFAVALAEHAADDLRVDHQASFPQAKSPEPHKVSEDSKQQASVVCEAQKVQQQSIETTESTVQAASNTEVVKKSTEVGISLTSSNVIEKSVESQVSQSQKTVSESTVSSYQTVSEESKSSTFTQAISESKSVSANKEEKAEQVKQVQEIKSIETSTEKESISKAKDASAVTVVAEATKPTPIVTEQVKSETTVDTKSKAVEVSSSASQQSTEVTVVQTTAKTTAATAVGESEVSRLSTASSEVTQTVKANEVASELKKEEQAKSEEKVVATSEEKVVDQTGVVAASEVENQEANMSRKYSSSQIVEGNINHL